jgi:glutathione S-transferase
LPNGIPCHTHTPQPYKKEAAFLKLNPLGLVPTIEVGQGSGKGLYESDVLVEFLEDLVPPSDDHPWVSSVGPGSAVRFDMRVTRADMTIADEISDRYTPVGHMRRAGQG